MVIFGQKCPKIVPKRVKIGFWKCQNQSVKMLYTVISPTVNISKFSIPNFRIIRKISSSVMTLLWVFKIDPWKGVQTGLVFSQTYQRSMTLVPRIEHASKSSALLAYRSIFLSSRNKMAGRRFWFSVRTLATPGNKSALDFDACSIVYRSIL